MTPDSFFHINPDIKPGSIRDDSEDFYAVPKPKRAASASKDFKKIFDNDDQTEAPANEDEEKTKNIFAVQGDASGNKEMLQQFVKNSTDPGLELDPLFNQMSSIAKDSKVAPKLGAEMPAAPAEEPWAVPYIESKMNLNDLVPAKEEPDMMGQQNLNQPRAFPLDPVEMQIRANPKLTPYGIGSFDKSKVLSPADAYASEMTKMKNNKGEEDIGKTTTPITWMEAPQTPTIGSVGANIPSLANLATAAHIRDAIQQIANQIVSQINIVSDKGQTDVTLILNQAGIFQGASVTVTSYATAPGEFNISFQNLSQAAKNILDENHASLRQALSGFVVHMITTSTTTIDRPYAADTFTPNKDGRRDADDNSRQQKRQQQQES